MSMLLCVIMLVTMGVSALANTPQNHEDYVILFSYTRCEEEMQAELEADITFYLSRSRTNNPVRVVQSAPRTAFITGRPSGQLPGGERFANGGGWWFAESGGPTASVSVSLPAPWNMISVSTNLGQTGRLGRFYFAPDTVNRWHLYNRVEMRITPWTIYEQVAPNHWVVFQRGQTTQRWGRDGFARRA